MYVQRREDSMVIDMESNMKGRKVRRDILSCNGV